MMDWIRTPRKSIKNVSNQWKAVQAFPLIGSYLAWNVGDGTCVRLGADAIAGCGNDIFLPQELILQLQERGLFKLNHVSNPGITDIWHQGWMSAGMLGLEGEYADLWNTFLSEMDRAHIRLEGGSIRNNMGQK
jgi:hypothetical protein